MPLMPIGTTYDSGLVLEDGVATVTVDRAGSVSQVDLGQGLFIGAVYLDVASFDTTTGDEQVIVHVVGATASGMATTKVLLASRVLADDTQIYADQDHPVTMPARFIIPFINVDENGELQRYVRLYFDANGTTPIMQCKAYIGAMPSS